MPGGLLLDWRADAFVPNATPDDTLALLRDYNHLSRFYSPQVESSRLLAGDGRFATIAMRIHRKAVVDIVLDAQYAVETGMTGDRYSISRSTHIWEIDGVGSPHEHRRPEGDDDGFLWRLNSYWSFVELDDGLLIECEAVSLTRDVPPGLGWLITPIVEDLPRSSLAFTVSATKTALLARATKEAHP